ncbi:hypothetical protein ACFLTP_03335 [Chloroflexota bacterium]
MYRLVKFNVRVKNQGANGIVLFQAKCQASVDDGILGNNPQTMSFSLAKDAEEVIHFNFWVRPDLQYTHEYNLEAQAVNAADLVVVEE